MAGSIARSLIFVLPFAMAMALTDEASAADKKAAPPELQIDSADTTLQIHGRLGPQTTAFSGDVRLTLTGAQEAEVVFVPSHLARRDHPGELIDRNQLSLPAKLKLQPGQPQDVRITINNVTRPGTYEGSIKIWLAGQSAEQAKEVKLTLAIDPQIDVKPVEDSLSLQIVNCHNQLSCAVARLFLSANMLRRELLVRLDNRTLGDVKVTQAVVLLRGDHSGPIGSAVSVDPAIHTLPARQVSTVRLSVDATKLVADRYQGSLRFDLDGAEPVTVRLDLGLRNGPLLPLLILLLGISVGRLARDLQTPQALLEMKLRPQLDDLESRLKDIDDSDAEYWRQVKIGELKQRVEAARETEDVLAGAIDRVRQELILLAWFHKVDLTRLATSDQAKVNEAIKTARADLRKDDIDEANKQRQAIMEILDNLRRDTTRGSGADALLAQIDELTKSLDTTLALTTSPPHAAEPSRLESFLQGLLNWVSGAPLSSAARYRYARPLLGVVLLALLVLIGLNTLYINAAAPFGAGGFYDYLGLFLWGISADIAQRTLQNLPSK